MLLSEAEVCFHNCAAPLLIGKAEYGMLNKGLAACHVTLSEAKAEFALSQQVADLAQAPVEAPAARHVLLLFVTMQYKSYNFSVLVTDY